MTTKTEDEKLFFNGVHGRTGRYLVDPIRFSEVASAVLTEPPRPVLSRWLRRLAELVDRVHLALPDEADPRNLGHTGWALVFHEEESAEVKEALEPLLEHRRHAAGPRTRVLDYRTGDEWPDWLTRHGVALGRINPDRIPYYLLLVGDPEKIPFRFQQTLAVEYAVGRLGFARPEDYRRYARSLLACENAESPLHDGTVSFFAPCHDKATRMSEDLLVRPLAEGGPADPGIVRRKGFEVRSLRGDEARRENLAQILGKQRPPAVLFTASHGVRWDAGDPKQEPWQGCLLCQDWTGGSPPEPAEHCFGAEHLGDEAHVHGLIGFFFACYSAGTPDYDQYPLKPGPPPRLARRPFLAALPQRFLAHPRGGALAMIGHVDRAWSFSFHSSQVGAQVQPFENALARLLDGVPVGHAVKDFRELYAVCSTQVSHLLRHTAWGIDIPPQDQEKLVHAWIQRNDAQNYVVLGDPAARMPLGRHHEVE